MQGEPRPGNAAEGGSHPGVTGQDAHFSFAANSQRFYVTPHAPGAARPPLPSTIRPTASRPSTTRSPHATTSTHAVPAVMEYAAAHATYASPTSMDAAVPAPAVSSATTTETSAQDVGTPLTEAVGAAAATPSTAVTTPLSVGEAAMAEAAAALPSHAATRPNVSGFAVSMQQAAERAVSSARRAVERRESVSQHGQLSASTVEAEDGDVQGRTAVFVMRDFVPDSTNHIRVQLCQEREGDWCLFVETRAQEQNITTVFRLPHPTGESLRLQLRRRGFGDVRTATQETVVANEEERQAIFLAMRMTPEASIAVVDGLLQPAELQPRQLQFMNGQSNTQAAGAGEHRHVHSVRRNNVNNEQAEHIARLV